MSKATIVIRGDTATCSNCRALIGASGLLKNSDFAALFPGADVVIADKSTDPKSFSKYASKLSGDWPVIGVYDGAGKFKGRFTARKTTVKPWTAARFAELVNAVCPECCAGGCSDPGTGSGAGGCGCSGVCKSCGAKVVFCQSCGKEL